LVEVKKETYMIVSRFVAFAMLFATLISCDAEESVSASSTESRGVISVSQQQALDAAATVEQTLLDSAAQREKELQERLQ
jgi:hypothetical protein